MKDADATLGQLKKMTPAEQIAWADSVYGEDLGEHSIGRKRVTRKGRRRSGKIIRLS